MNEQNKRKPHPMKGRKQSKETIAKRMATLKAKRSALMEGHNMDIKGAIAELRLARRLIMAQIRRQEIPWPDGVGRRVLNALECLGDM